jgi:Cys-rich four helix bundle protein (predicted Tat secretion target)
MHESEHTAEHKAEPERSAGPALGRREFALGAAAAAAAAALAVGARAAEPAPAAGAQRPRLAELAANCVQVGEQCLSHCLAMLRGGDTSLAACAQLVYEMLPACTALGRMADAQSAQLAGFSAACAALCESCEKECRVHAEHDICKRCADACAALGTALRA